MGSKGVKNEISGISPVKISNYAPGRRQGGFQEAPDYIEGLQATAQFKRQDGGDPDCDTLRICCCPPDLSANYFEKIFLP